MPFRVIRGTYHVVGYAPDGDSVRFRADDPANWAFLDGPPASLNARGHAQLRLEAIDALETHFQSSHQPPALAVAARSALLQHAGVTGVVWNANETRVVAAADGTPGYILSRVVEPNRRPVAFVYAGAPPEADGTTAFVDQARVEASINFKLLQAGLVYPTYYEGLFPDLRAAFTAASQAARAAGLGVFAADVTNAGFAVPDLAAIEDDLIILPKLFRRLAAYLEAGGSVVGFKAHLAALGERILIMSTAHATHFDTIITEVGTTIRMTEPPENVMFQGQ